MLIKAIALFEKAAERGAGRAMHGLVTYPFTSDSNMRLMTYILSPFSRAFMRKPLSR
jgi:hypothetical protein